MFCPKCGNETDDSFDFCPKCGYSFKQTTVKQPAPQSNQKKSNDLKDVLNAKSYTNMYLISSVLFWISVVLCKISIIFVVVAFVIFIFSFMSLFYAITKDKKKLKAILALVANIVILFAIVPALSSSSSSKSTTATTTQQVDISKTENTTVAPIEEQVQEEPTVVEEVTQIETETVVEEPTPQITLEELKAQCIDYKYKDVLRNPQDYVGQYVHVRVKISSVHEAGWLNDRKYYFAYTKDEYGWYGDRYGVYDCREEGSQKLLTDDVIDVWGVIADPQETTSLIVNSEELFVIDMLYSELISE